MLVRVTETDVKLEDGRTLHAYDARSEGDSDRLPIFWHHGTPNIGEPPEPLFAEAAKLGLRWVSYDRPGYGGSTVDGGRNIASAASDVAAIADALGIERFAVMGHSGGSMHALACGALLPERVACSVCVSSLAPIAGSGLDWFAGMAPAGEAELRAAVAGRAALAHHLATSDFDPGIFTDADMAALKGSWLWLWNVAGKGMLSGPDGMIDDDLALVNEWGFEPRRVSTPVLFLHGGDDRIAPLAHAKWLAGQCRRAELWVRPEDGHVSVLSSAVAAMEWVIQHAATTAP